MWLWLWLWLWLLVTTTTTTRLLFACSFACLLCCVFVVFAICRCRFCNVFVLAICCCCLFLLVVLRNAHAPSRAPPTTHPRTAHEVDHGANAGELDLRVSVLLGTHGARVRQERELLLLLHKFDTHGARQGRELLLLLHKFDTHGARVRQGRELLLLHKFWRPNAWVQFAFVGNATD